MTEPPDFDRLFRSVARSAVHLEMRDDGGSSPAFAAWREHRPYDRSGPDASWHALVGTVIQRGAAVRRARIISEPASDYIRFEYEVTPAANLAAGEQVRWRRWGSSGHRVAGRARRRQAVRIGVRDGLGPCRAARGIPARLAGDCPQCRFAQPPLSRRSTRWPHGCGKSARTPN